MDHFLESYKMLENFKRIVVRKVEEKHRKINY